MGHRPPRQSNPPTRESFHLGMAKSAYVKGELTLAEFEIVVEHVLSGGHFHYTSGRPYMTPFPVAWWSS
jgi:hypothetical protein